MAIGSNRTSLNVIYVKLMGFKKADKDAPYLSFAKKDGDTYPEYLQDKAVSGLVTGLEVNDFIYEKKPKRTYRLSLIDEKTQEKYVVEVSESNHGRNILNSILSMEDFLRPIEISVYLKKGKDGKSYPNVSVQYADTIDTNDYVKWKFPFAELNTMVTVTKDEDGETVRNFKKLNTFFNKEVEEFIKKFGFEKKQLPKKDKPAETSTPKVNVKEEMEQEDPGPPPVSEDDEPPF